MQFDVNNDDNNAGDHDSHHNDDDTLKLPFLVISLCKIDFKDTIGILYDSNKKIIRIFKNR